MRTRIALAAIGIAAAGMAGAERRALAQQDQAQAPPVAGSLTLGVTGEESKAIALGYRASKLLGAAVYNDRNEKIGKIGDLIVKPDGTLSFAIVDVGGFLGLKKPPVAIPMGQFSSTHPKVVLPGATKDALKKLPEFEFAQS